MDVSMPSLTPMPVMKDKIYSNIPLNRRKPLIRLLNIEPHDSADALLQCTLFRSPINARYYCLSYTWGESTPCYDILVNGQVMSVRQNLFDFLRQMRKASKSKKFDRSLWIDAICIDQTNTAERNCQVQYMGRIYARAQCVLLWLGTSSGLAIALEMLHNRQHHDRLGQQVSIVINDLFFNPYWSRAWVTQEIGLSRRTFVFGGDEMTSYHTLVKAAGSPNLFSSNGDSLIGISPMSIYVGISTRLHEKPLLALLSRFRFKQCSILRDRIYSLLALCTRNNRFDVDYDLPAIDLVVLVLQHCEENVCFCTVGLLAQVLGLGGTDIPDDHLHHRYPYIEFAVNSLVPGDFLSGTYEFTTCGARMWTTNISKGNTKFVSLPETPCVRVSHHETYQSPNPHSPPRRSFNLQKGLTLTQDLSGVRRNPTCNLQMPLLIWIKLLAGEMPLCRRGRSSRKRSQNYPSCLRIGYTASGEDVETSVE